MKKIVLYGKSGSGRFVLVDDEDYEYLNQWHWMDNGHGYVKRSSRKGTIKMHRIIMNNPKGKTIDHINGNKLDNRRSNLRICTQSENMKNMNRPIRNKSGYKGVFKVGRKYKAYINSNGKRKHLGYFETPELAASIYNQYAIKYHGEFANLNKL